MRRLILRGSLLPLLATILTGSATADGKRKAAQEVAEYAIQRFGRSAAKGTVQTLATKIESTAARHGPDVLTAVRKVGPRAIPLVEEAGAHGKQAAQILARHGEAGAVWVVTRPAAMTLATRHGDRAAAVLVKHAGVAEPVIGKFGAPAVRALEAVGPQSGRRMAMLAADGQLARIGRTEEVLEVVARYGDRGAKFVWDNKGALAVGTVLTAFLASPEPFINGTRDITKVAGETVVTPVVTPIAKGVGTAVSVGLIALYVSLAAAAILAFRHRRPLVKAVSAWWAKRTQKA
jgi:hypothetical protein